MIKLALFVTDAADALESSSEGLLWVLVTGLVRWNTCTECGVKQRPYI